MQALFYILTLIGMTVAFASVVPTCQYIYVKHIAKNSLPITYYFSQQLFDTHLDKNLATKTIPMCRAVLSNEELSEMWNKEMKYNLP